MFKSIIYLLATLLFMGGCSYKNEPISLSSYKGEYAGDTSEKKKTIYLRSIKDIREDKNNVGYMLIEDTKKRTFHSETDFEKKYAEGLRQALALANFKITSNENEASLVLDVKISKIEIIYNDKSFDKNLEGELQIEVVITKGQDVTKVNFKPKASKWIGSSYDSKDMEPFLYELFSDNINAIVSKTTTY